MIKQLTVIAIFFFAMIPTAKAQFSDWQYSGSMSVLTTPEGADLPATAAIEKFPLLVRLDKDFFDFKQAQPYGEDLRLAVDGKALPYQIEQWDAANGKASVWVLMPTIQGNSRQKIQVYWGNADAKSDSNPKAVFNEANGYASVWHMSEPVVDDAGGTNSKDEGTTPSVGIIGEARHLDCWSWSLWRRQDYSLSVWCRADDNGDLVSRRADQWHGAGLGRREAALQSDVQFP